MTGVRAAVGDRLVMSSIRRVVAIRIRQLRPLVPRMGTAILVLLLQSWDGFLTVSSRLPGQEFRFG